jgi:hypothetical protein
MSWNLIKWESIKRRRREKGYNEAHIEEESKINRALIQV